MDQCPRSIGVRHNRPDIVGVRMTCVLDTNIILDNDLDNIIASQPKDCAIIIPMIVLEELDKFKNGSDTKSAHCRAAIRLLGSIIDKGNITEGIKYKKRIIRVCGDDIDKAKADNRIISVAHDMDAVLITNDIHERVIANSLGIDTANIHQKPKAYDKIKQIKLTDKQATQLSTQQYVETSKKLYPNQFVKMVDSAGGIQYGRYHQKDKRIYRLKPHYNLWNVKPSKADETSYIEQLMYMDLLTDPRVEFITCLGPSGTGKTYIALAAALEQIINNNIYNKLTVMRPLVAIGEDIGYLPGDKNEKLENWMGSTFDNLEQLLCNYKAKDEMYVTPRDKVYNLINNGTLEIEAITYIRGRTMPNQFVIVDDCFTDNTQIMTDHGIMTIKEIYEADYKPMALSYDNGFVYNRIVNVVKKQPKRVVNITTNTAQFSCTPDHKFLTTNGWEALHLGSIIYAYNTSPERVLAVNSGPITDVYDMEIENAHNFVVTSNGTTGVIAHNCQNLTISQATTILTRMGEHSKLVFLGDVNPKQIDSQYLSPSYNGLAYVIDKLYGADDIIGHISLHSVVRSALAEIAVCRL